jgi:hypothetical protein
MPGIATITPGMTDEDIRKAARRADELVVEGDDDFRRRVAAIFDVPPADVEQSVPEPVLVRDSGRADGLVLLDTPGVDAKPPPPAQVAPGGSSGTAERPLAPTAMRRPIPGAAVWIAAVTFLAALAAIFFIYLDAEKPGGSPLNVADAPALNAPGPPDKAVGEPAATPGSPPAAPLDTQQSTAAPRVPPDLEPSTTAPAKVEPPPSAAVELARALAWPVVALVVVMVVAFLAMRAMSTGHSVDVRWKVAKIGEGRMVLRKTTTRMPRRAT